MVLALIVESLDSKWLFKCLDLVLILVGWALMFDSILVTFSACLVCGCVVPAVLFQSIFAIVFYRVLVKEQPANDLGDTPPKVAILIPLRGLDDCLEVSLTRLLAQDYADYYVHVIVDSASDPALSVVKKVQERSGADRMRVSILRKKPNRSPYSTALTQGLRELDDSVEVVALVDGDVEAHSSWLLSLVQPLMSDAKIGAVHGNRWYLPPDDSWGTLVRYLWNAAAVVVMWFFHIPWSGTFAIKRSVIEDTDLLSRWERSLVLDAPTQSVMKENDLRIQFVPNLMMTNVESCGFADGHDFIKRQMTWTRTYHPFWLPVLFHAFITSLLLLIAIGGAIYGVATRNVAMFAWNLGGLTFYTASMMALLALIEHGVHLSLKRRGDEVPVMKSAARLKLPIAIQLAQLVHFSTVCLATFKKRVSWRGVLYEIRGPFDIRVVDDRTPPPSRPVIQS